MAPGARLPSIRQATRYSSWDSWTIWPSARRIRAGGFVKPLSFSSPSNSIPSASRGG